jgi:hypothetical protein
MNGREVMIAYYAALCAQVCSLEARYDACVTYALNVALQIEASITLKQIDALKAEIEISKMHLEKHQ